MWCPRMTLTAWIYGALQSAVSLGALGGGEAEPSRVSKKVAVD